MDTPDGPLRAARLALGWSQARAADELTRLAATRGVPVAAAHSLKTQLSRWENRHAVPDPNYRSLLCELFDGTETELGLLGAVAEPSARPVDVGRPTLHTQLTAAAGLDGSALDLLRDQLRSHRALDHRLGAVAVRESARELSAYLRGTLLHAVRPGVRHILSALVVDAATLAGRLAHDSGDPDEGWAELGAARTAALETESSAMLAHVLAEQSAMLSDIDELPAAVELSTAAEELTAGADPPLRARVLAAHGTALARSGLREPARASYDEAERTLDGQTPHRTDEFSRPPFAPFDLPAVRRHRGHAYRLLNDHSSAEEELLEALRAGGASSRDLAGLHVDLAFVNTALGHPTVAFDHARSARDLASRLGVVRVTAELASAGLRDLRPLERADRVH
jgi:transcriptional regulator with XRE-family HTH domain